MSRTYFLMLTEAIVAIGGISYAIHPQRWMKKPDGEQSVSPKDMKKARIMGIVIALAAIAVLVFDVITYFGAAD